MKLAQKIVLGYIKARLHLVAAFSHQLAAKKAFHLFCTPLHRKKKEQPDVFAHAEKLKMILNGKTVAGYRWNHPQPRKVLIAHGFESSSWNFDRYVRPLMRLGYEVLAFDAPAHGQSGGRQVTLVDYSDMLVKINREYGPLQAAMAHSFGGLALTLALEEMAAEKEIAGDMKMVLIAPATETGTAIRSFFKLLDLNEKVETTFRELIRNLSSRPVEWFSIKRALPSLPVSTLWLHDEDDEITPVSDIRPLMDAQYPQILFHITKGLGHRKIYRDNNIKRRILEFLDPEKA